MVIVGDMVRKAMELQDDVGIAALENCTKQVASEGLKDRSESLKD